MLLPSRASFAAEAVSESENCTKACKTEETVGRSNLIGFRVLNAARNQTKKIIKVFLEYKPEIQQSFQT